MYAPKLFCIAKLMKASWIITKLLHINYMQFINYRANIHVKQLTFDENFRETSLSNLVYFVKNFDVPKNAFVVVLFLS